MVAWNRVYVAVLLWSSRIQAIQATALVSYYYSLWLDSTAFVCLMRVLPRCCVGERVLLSLITSEVRFLIAVS
jgi:hypothetical protein